MYHKKKTNNMSPEAQRIAIAGACGWIEVRAEVDWLPGELTGIFTWPHPTKTDETKYYISRKPVPNYLYDLNAMHRAEKKLTLVQWDEYLGILYSLVQDPHICSLTHAMAYVCATAAQRAEAFLRTLGLWDENKNPQ
jgi:hypothetical protein